MSNIALQNVVHKSVVATACFVADDLENILGKYICPKKA